MLIYAGRNSWKEDPVSPEYDYVLLQKRLQQFREARAAGDLSRVLFLLRVSLSRTFAHAGNPEVSVARPPRHFVDKGGQLYRHTNIGTKRVIEEYICEVQEALEFLLRAESPLVSDATKLDQLTCLRQAYGRTALLLSGGGTLGMNHVGVLSALFERNMLPRIINGTSAGSIVAGVCCTRTDDELPQILNDFIHGDLNVFQDSLNPETVYDHIARLLKIGTIHGKEERFDDNRCVVGYFVFDTGDANSRRRSDLPRSLRSSLSHLLSLFWPNPCS